MRYDFECTTCSSVFEHVCSMSERPESLPCRCGGAARHVILSVPESFVRGRPIQFNPERCVPSFGRAFGRSDEQQHAEHARVIRETRTREHERRRSCSKGDRDFQLVGLAPMEAVLSYDEHTGQKESAQVDPVDFHKRMGTYMGDT